MASLLETAEAALRLHDALNTKARDLAFGTEAMNLFEPLRLEIAAAMDAYAERPANGADAPAYDAPRAACDQAAKAVGAAQPQPGQDRAALIAATHTAASALKAVTRPAGLLAGLAGALRLPAPPRRAPVAPDSAVARDIAFGAAPVAAAAGAGAGGQATPTGDPNYYQKLTNLFPAEGLALYGTGVALYSGANAIVVLGTLAVLVVLRWSAYGSDGGGGPRWRAVLVAVASFLLWATATDPGWLRSFTALSPELAEHIRHGAAFLGAAAVLLAPLAVKVPTK